MTAAAILVPPHVKAQIADAAVDKLSTSDGRMEIAEAGRKAKQLPVPVGYHLLVAIPEVSQEFESGLVKADVTRAREEVSTVVGLVVAMGPDCYKDIKKFPTGAWCKEGDFVLMRAYSGTRFLVHGKEWRILNDDSIEAVVEDPRGLSRA